MCLNDNNKLDFLNQKLIKSPKILENIISGLTIVYIKNRNFFSLNIFNCEIFLDHLQNQNLIEISLNSSGNYYLIKWLKSKTIKFSVLNYYHI